MVDDSSSRPPGDIPEINFSHYRPTPDTRRFSISTFAVSGQLLWEAKPAGEFAARIDVVKGAFAKMIPFQAVEATVKIVGAEKNHPGTKVFSQATVGGRAAKERDGEIKEKSWSNLAVISPIELPWVAEYALQRWSVGGPQETYFTFEDTQRVRTAVIYFRENADRGDALAVLRVLKPDEKPTSIASTQKISKPGDVLITFRESQIAGFTVSVPIVGKLQFVRV